MSVPPVSVCVAQRRSMAGPIHGMRTPHEPEHKSQLTDAIYHNQFGFSHSAHAPWTPAAVHIRRDPRRPLCAEPRSALPSALQLYVASAAPRASRPLVRGRGVLRRGEDSRTR